MKYKEIIAYNNPSQSHWEMNELLCDLERIKISRILEIGTHMGGSARVWRDVFSPKLLVCVDIQNDLEEAKNNDNLTFIEGNSQDQQVRQAVLDKLGANKFDFIFLDGSHYYNDVKADFEYYSQLVRAGGVIGFHDVMIRGNDTCEVYRYWEELRHAHKTKTIWDGTPAGTGEGLLYV